MRGAGPRADATGLIPGVAAARDGPRPPLASEELKTLGREGRDRRWRIALTGSIDKVGTFVALFGGSKLNIAVITDLHQGDKAKGPGPQEAAWRRARDRADGRESGARRLRPLRSSALQRRLCPPDGC
jgi:hypothetical protein